MLLDEQDGAKVCVVVIGCWNVVACVNEVGKGEDEAGDKTDGCGVEGQEEEWFQYGGEKRSYAGGCP